MQSRSGGYDRTQVVTQTVKATPTLLDRESETEIYNKSLLSGTDIRHSDHCTACTINQVD